MFERVYGEKATKIFRNCDTAKWDKKKTTILKIHGDLDDLENIILTSKDYSSFFYKDKASPFLSMISNEIATKTILFIGYGYEDSNIWAIFNHVADYLGENKRPAFFIGRSLTEYKIDFLKRNGITYIESSVEDFFEELLENILANIRDDLHKGLVSADTFRGFCNLHNIKPGIADTGGGYILISAESLDGNPLNGNIKFTVNKDSGFREKQIAFLNDELDELKLDKESIQNFVMNVQGIKFMGQNEIVDFSWKKVSSGTFYFDLAFLDRNFEIRNLEIVVFNTIKGFTFKIKIHTLSLEIKLFNPNSEIAQLKWTMAHEEIYNNVAEELEVYNFIKYFCSGEEFTIFFKNGSQITKRSPPANEVFISDADIFIDYFKKLQEVEKVFKVKFRNFYGINKGTLEDLNWLIKVIRGERFVIENSLEFTMSSIDDLAIESFEKLNEGIYPLDFGGNIVGHMELHGQKMSLHQKWIHVLSAEVTNLNLLKTGKTRVVHVKSRSGIIYETYKYNHNDKLEGDS